MAIDMRQFHQTFFEESIEGIAAMESQVLGLEQMLSQEKHPRAMDVDPEILNAIFRVVHSIKGGSSTFGFSDIAEFSHVLETLLDEVRAGRHAIDRAVLNLLLRAVDCMRLLFKSAREGTTADKAAVAEVCAALETLSHGPSALKVEPAAKAAESGNWHVNFRPHSRLFETGNDPIRILRELSSLGELQVSVNTNAFPTWKEFDPQACYLGWSMQLKGASRLAIEEAFAWVVDDCDLTITADQPAPAVSHTDGAGQTQIEETASSIRVSTRKVDVLVDMVGELVITQTMLTELVSNFDIESLARLRSGLAQLERNTRELQECVLGIRMLPIGFVFSRLPRLVRDVAHQRGKKAELTITGERTELDKTIIERISDPLLHLVRNSIDHGIETTEERVAAGKPEVAVIKLDAYHKAGNVVIAVEDDGRGLDRNKILTKAREQGLVPAQGEIPDDEIDELIFLPGFSTAGAVDDLSGRGVGLDVVRNNIRSLGGNVEVISRPGRGVCFLLRLPLTLSIVDGMNVQVGAQTYILPLVWIAESLRLKPNQISRLANGPEVFGLRQEYLPLLRLHEVFDVPTQTTSLDGIVVVVEAEGKKAGLYVDDLRGQQQVVLKSLETHCCKITGISAATILGDGSVALILDPIALVRLAHTRPATFLSNVNQPVTNSNLSVAGPSVHTGQALRN